MKQIDYLRKSRKNCSALLMACALTFMLLTTTLSFAQTNSLTLGCPTRNGNNYQYQDLSFTTSTDFVVTSISVSFSDDPASCSIALPTLPTGWSVDPSSNEYSKYIILPEGTDDVTIRDFLSGITYTVPDNSIKNVQIILLPVAAGKIIRYSENGHYYQFVPFTEAEADWTWIDCYNAAKEMTYCGRQGYLATLTSLGEDKFVTRLVSSSMWIGGTRLSPTDDATSTGTQYYDSFDVQDNYRATNALSGDYWYWACGPEKGTRITNEVTNSNGNLAWYENQPSYSNWCWQNGWNAEFEPNNAGHNDGEWWDPSYTYESCLTILNIGRNSVHNHTDGIGWNDIGYDRNIMGNFSDQNIWLPQGFMVEYGNQIIGDTNPETDECSISASGKVGNANDTSRVTLSGNDAVCIGEEATLTLLFEGAYPFTGKVTGGGQEYPFTTNDVFYTFTVTPTETTTYTVSEFTDNSSTTGSDGCLGVYSIVYETSGSATVTVNNPQVALTDIAPVAICAGASTNLTATTTGTVTDNVAYEWSPATGLSATTGATVTANPSETTIYTVTATATQGGCAATATKEVTVTVNELPTATVSVTDVKCNGAGDGIITVNANGGSGSYQYQLGTGTFQASNIFAELAAGDYTLTVKDGNSCTTTATTIVAEPAQLTLTEVTATDETCKENNDGTISYTVGGGTPNYTITFAEGISVTQNAAGTYTQSDLSAGDYVVKVVDHNGCSVTAPAVTIDEPATLVINQVGNIISAQCKGDNNGQFAFSIAGGNGTNTITINGGAVTLATPSDGVYTQTGLAAGTYTVSVTDNKGCSATKNFVVGEPAEVLSATVTSTQESCTGNDGTATVAAEGGNGEYTFDWSNDQHSATATNLSSFTNGGVYTVTVSDAKGCKNVQNVTITLNNPLAMEPITGPAVCTGTEFSITPENGTNGTIPAGTTYSWPAPSAIPGIGGLAAGTDKSSINGVLTNSNSTPQTVSYTVTPKVGVCVGNAVDVTVTVTTTVNPNVTIDMPNTMTVCSNAEIFNLSATFVNSVSNSTVVWKKDGTTMATHTVTGDTDSYAIDLANDTCKGQYTYRVEYTDVSGCTASDACVITVNAGDWSISQPAGTAVECVSAATEPDESLLPIVYDGCGRVTDRTLLRRESSPTEITCAGTVTYTYRYTACDDTYKDWTYTYTINDVTKPTIAADAITTKAANIDQTACKFSIPDLTADIRAKASDNCTEAADLVITQEPEFGTVITAATDVVVTVTDKCGNSTTHTVNVTVPTLPTATIAPTHILCHGNTTGSATVTPTSGTAPYTYLWSNSQTVATATDLDNTEYTVTVTDANGCTTTASVTITEPALLQISSITPTNITCPSGNDGKIEVDVTGGTTPYSYQLNGGTAQSSAIFETLTAGSYTVTVTDANGCSTTSSTTLTQPTPLTLTGCPTNITENTDADKSYATVTWTEPAFSPIGNDATLSVTGKTATNQYSVGTTTITYTVTNTCGESQSCSFTITVSDNQAPVITCPPSLTVACETDTLPILTTYADFVEAGGEATDNDGIDELSFRLSGYSKVGTCPTTITRTYYIEDITGNNATCKQVITIKDSIAPALAEGMSLPSGESDMDLCYAAIPSGPSAEEIKALYVDNCSEVTVTKSGEPTGDNCEWSIIYTYVIEDACHNTTTATVSYSGSDKTAPVLTGTWPANITGQNNCFANRNISGLLSNDAVKDLYTDNCGGELTVDSSDVVTGDDCGWTVTRTYTIKDSCGNTVMPKPTMIVSGRDQTAPALTGTWPTNITGQDNCFANADTAGLKDDSEIKALYEDCSGITVSHSDANTLTDDCGWTVTRTYTIKDACNNIVTPAPTMSVSGSDQTAPALSGTWPDNITGQDNCFANAVTSGLYTDDQVKALYSDCSTITVTHTDANTLTDDCGWTITRTYTIKDACNNTVTKTMSVSGKDQTAPALTGTWPSNITGQDNCFANAVTSGLYTDDQVKALYSDCSTITVTHTDANTLTDDCGWTITRAYTIKDACGNTVTPAPAMSVSGSDQTAPALIDSWPDNITGKNSCLSNADTTGLKDDSEIKALYSDCSTITVTHTDTIEGDACDWTVTRTYTIKDSCGNTVTPAPTMSVSGSDQTAPAIGTDDLDHTLTSTNCVFKIPDMREIVRNISTDCSEITVTQPSAGMVVYPMVAERDTTVNVIVTDSCGNSSVKEVVITIPAKVTISATATPAVICNGGTSQLSAIPANVVGTAVYAWTPATELSSATIANPTVTLTASGAAATTTYTVHVTDDNGCTATATASVTVNPEVVMNTVTDWTLCVGETSPEYVYTSTITDGTVTYGWSNDNSAIGLAAAGSGNLPSFVAANSTSADLIAEIKVAPTYINNGISCQGDSINFHITVRPSIKTPGNVAFTCPADTTVVLSYSECEQFVNIGYPEFVNNMSGMTVNITNDAPEGNIFPEGTTIVTWTATDECGAFLTCTQNVVVQFPSCGDSIADFDGYRYSSVRIGCQCWTGENARSEHYSDGTPVDNFRYYNDSDSLENIYGKLYTWYTAVRVPEGDNNAEPSISTDPFGTTYVQGICPEGWALPTVNEYMLMIANSGDATHAKDGSNLYWLPGYEGQPPFSGFDAYGAGKYNGAIDRYQELLGKTHFWTTLSGSGSETATTVEINYYCAEGLQTELSKGDGVSIRCIRKR